MELDIRTLLIVKQPETRGRFSCPLPSRDKGTVLRDKGTVLQGQGDGSPGGQGDGSPVPFLLDKNWPPNGSIKKGDTNAKASKEEK